MKFLEIPTFAQLSELLDGVSSTSGESTIYGKIEAFSCKQAGSVKKLYKSLEEQYQVELSKSPDLIATSPFGPLDQSSSRKTLIYLIALLNASFPDYDFSKVKPEQFRKENNVYMVMNNINAILNGVIPNYNNELSPKLWTSLEQEIKLKECDMYSYIPDLDSDPYAEQGNIWSFNYFFFNRKLKRVVFFTCRAFSKIGSLEDNDFNTNVKGAWMYDDLAEEMEF
mmetsp:Transcript_24008/g.33659  ORF Transcript_24008/g.33659 Transcript_24008/m.33659 type:complete len:225 (-) Transcript_24008:132-806(-)|eukprot:CAMPEP_0168560930 /NCGR_PEP_ID=MMETSP0413-20121227/11322_1 /TAXON_ID=136452 /ORGANISM="Filamoeba nolandi, Strain NC-AS-23-1" /LENGTH=224 /DNA_ID=CAMNT_0008592263 /DNA_START=28 /DNA_END=702 /DNA_ORIENTATION=+